VASPAGSLFATSPSAWAGLPRRSRGRSRPTAGASPTGLVTFTPSLAWGHVARRLAKLAACPRLRGVVEAKLEKRWSPQQIAGWLPRAYPKHPEMRVSHETIYMSLFVQGRGALRQELFRSLRQGRALHCPKGARQPSGKGIINDMVIISERPAEIEDRAVPGHWEGDLVRHEALFDRAVMKGHRRRDVAAARLKLRAA
jgi:IS30 family transposase